MATMLQNVSRETTARLNAFEALVRKWNPTINLISKGSLQDIRARHICDSAQLFDLAPGGARHWVDLGSGGGFPGVVIAILMAEANPDGRVTLVESDQRKSAFLQTALRVTSVNGVVISKRIEELAPMEADVLSARALGDLGKLLPFAARHLKPGGTALFPKGKTWKAEIDSVKSQWNFEHRVDMNDLEPDAAILSIQGVSRV